MAEQRYRSNRVIVGLCGLAGSGKSTASRLIQNAYNIPRRPFAYPLKRMIGALGVPTEVLDGPASVKELPTARLNGHTVRFALQTLGTEWGRKIMGEDFWVKQWAASFDNKMPGMVADDVRFPNEVEAIQKLGGIVIRIDRMGSGVQGDGSKHASEDIEKLEYDWRVTNNSTPNHLEHSLRRIIDEAFADPEQQLDLAVWPKAGSFGE